MVPLQYFLQCRSVFGCVGATVVPSISMSSSSACWVFPEQAVAGGQVRSVADVFDAGIACCVQGGDEQAEPGDGDGRILMSTPQTPSSVYRPVRESAEVSACCCHRSADGRWNAEKR